jgi:hypothetical protein
MTLLPHLHHKIAPIQRVSWNALFGGDDQVYR